MIKYYIPVGTPMRRRCTSFVDQSKLNGVDPSNWVDEGDFKVEWLECVSELPVYYVPEEMVAFFNERGQGAFLFTFYNDDDGWEEDMGRYRTIWQIEVLEKYVVRKIDENENNI